MGSGDGGPPPEAGPGTTDAAGPPTAAHLTEFGRQRHLLDVRPRARFEHQRLSGAANIPVAELRTRLFELPAPAAGPLCLLAEDEAAATLAADILLTAKWEVAHVVFDRPELWKDLSRDGEALATGAAYVRMWRPSPLVEDWLAHTPASRPGAAAGSVPRPPPLALDLGCGSGRDAVFLALHGWRVVGVDQRPCLLERASALAANSGVAHLFQATECDLQQDWPWEDATVDLVVCIRFLLRSSFPKIAAVLRPGGHLLYSHFLEGCAKPRDPRHLLRRGELAAAFGAVGFTVLQDSEGAIEDGRPVCNFIAMKR
eukprot:EG_transcript_15749